MMLALPIAVSLLVAWKSFHLFYEDVHDFLNSWSKGREYRNYYLWWKEPREWSEAATATGKLTIYLALVLGSGLLTFYGVRKIWGEL
jgi:hypothetical protein